MQPQDPNKTCKGAKLTFSKTHHFWCVTVAVALRSDNFKFVRPSLKDMLWDCCLKFQSARIFQRVTEITVVFYIIPFFVNFTVLSEEFPIVILSDDFATYSRQKSKRIPYKKNRMYHR